MEISLHFYFPFKAFPENERERERERARVREEKRRTARSRSRRREIAPDRDRDRAVDRDLRSRSLIVVDVFFWVVACVFLDLCFPSSFPNTRKYFLGNFLKCNQTHGNIFLFRKIAFPENMYFPENVLQQPFLSNSNFDNWVTFTKFVYNQLHFKGNLMSFSFS